MTMTTPSGGSGFKPFRLLVTGSRGWKDAQVVYDALSLAAQEFAVRHSQFTVVHGGASGADTMAHDWTAVQPRFGFTPVVEEVHRPDWTGEGRAAGVWRNRRMVESDIDLCLAFIRNNSTGATHCAKTAEAFDIPVRYYRDGQ